MPNGDAKRLHEHILREDYRNTEAHMTDTRSTINSEPAQRLKKEEVWDRDKKRRGDKVPFIRDGIG